MATDAQHVTSGYAVDTSFPEVHVRHTPGVVHRPRGRSRGERVESLLVAVVFGTLAFLLGYHTLTTNHVVVFTGLNRLTEAFQVLYDAPPKLAAIGFSLPPLPTLLMIPFTAIKPLASSLTALPLFSAVFFGLTMMILDRMLAKCEFALLPRLALLILFALNPMWAFYGSNGAPDIVYLFFLSVALYSFVSWYRGHETIYLIFGGTGMALCMMSRYGFISMAVLVAFLFASALWRNGAERDEVEGSVIAYLTPIVYAFALWTLLNAVIVSSPFGWLRTPGSSLSVNSNHILSSAHYSLPLVASHVLRVIVGTGPIAFVALPALVIGLVRERDSMSLWLAGLLALTVLLVGSEAVEAGNVGRVLLENGLPCSLVGFMGMAWVYATNQSLRLPIFAAMAAMLVLAIPLAWHAMQTYPYQDMEEGFVHAIQHPSENLTGTGSRGGYAVGVESEVRMAAYIKQAVGTKNHQVLTDNSQTYGVITLTGRPGVFIDRSQRGDGPWKKLLNKPYGRVRYILEALTPADLVRTRYPRAATGGTPELTPVFTTQRYVLLKVAAPLGTPLNPIPGTKKKKK
jgi:hypothetical protein